MGSILDTLKKIGYVNLEQFVEDINHNFAVVQNSPLYKGIPGIEGDEGNEGLRGSRGSQFIFVNFVNFQAQFPNELINSSDINLNYINVKLLNFADKQKLLIALDILELVDKDTIVLTNSTMLNYNIISNTFLNTGIAFNAQTNLLSSIESQIEQYVQYYINNNSTILGLSNLFSTFSTYAKNYADTSNVYITNQQLESSVYVPYYPGVTSDLNGTLVNHRYFGFTDQEFPRTGNGSIVFGSIKKYIDLLFATVSLSDGVTLTSDYAPGMNNIPAAIILQDTSNAGLMIGRKIKSNLRTFAHIYKNSLDELVIKSDSGPEPIDNKPSVDFSKLIIGKTRMKYDKIFDLNGDLNLNENLNLLGKFTSPFIRTDGKTLIEIGLEDSNSEYKNLSNEINFTKYLSRVLVTKANGVLSKDYSLEEMPLVANEEQGFVPITRIPNDPNKIVTSRYIGFLMRKINNMVQSNGGDYYKILDFRNGNIPELLLSNSLTVGDNVYLGGNIASNMLRVSSSNNNVTIGKNSTSIATLIGNLTLSNYIAKVLVTDHEGKISSAFSMESVTMNPLQEVGLNQITDIPTSRQNIVSSYYLGFLMRKINNIMTSLGNGGGGGNISGDFYTIANFQTGVIPILVLSDYLTVRGNASFGGFSENVSLLSVNISNNKVSIGKNSISLTEVKGDLTLTKLPNKVLVTDSTGKIRENCVLTAETSGGTVPNSYAVVPASTLDLENLIPINIGTRSNTDILTGSQNIWIISVINAIKVRLKNTFNRTESDARYMQSKSNLNDLENKATSRLNLDVYSKTEADARFQMKINNLSEIPDIDEARTNLDVLSKSEVPITIGQRLVFYAKINGYTGVISNTKNLLTSGFSPYFEKQNDGNYKIYFKNLANEVLELSNKYVLANSLDGGISGSLVGIRKCMIETMITPIAKANGQINIVGAAGTVSEDLIFEIFIHEFYI